MSKPGAPAKGAARKGKAAVKHDARADAGPASSAGMVEVTIALLPAQRAKLMRLGGAAWIRDRIDQAKIARD